MSTLVVTKQLSVVSLSVQRWGTNAEIPLCELCVREPSCNDFQKRHSYHTQQCDLHPIASDTRVG